MSEGIMSGRQKHHLHRACVFAVQTMENFIFMCTNKLESIFFQRKGEYKLIGCIEPQASENTATHSCNIQP